MSPFYTGGELCRAREPRAVRWSHLLIETSEIIAAAGWAENGLSFTPILGLLGLLALSALVGLLSYLVLQRIAEAMAGRTTTSIRELLIYTGVVVLLCMLLMIINGIYKP